MVTTKPDAVIIYDRTTPQYFRIDKPLIHNWLHFDGDVAPLLARYGIQTDTLYYPKSPSFITDICYELEVEFFGKPSYGDVLLQLKFEELLIKLARAIHDRGSTQLKWEERGKFRALRQEMFSDFSHHYTVEEMSTMVGYSPSRFYHLYKSFYGVSPTSDLINARLEKAKELLLDTQITVNEIAEHLGYANTVHFIRQFKARVGATPTEYRQKTVH